MIWSTNVSESEATLFLTKFLPLVVYPLGLTISLMLVGGVCASLKLWRWAASSVGAALILLWVCSGLPVSEFSRGSPAPGWQMKRTQDSIACSAFHLLHRAYQSAGAAFQAWMRVDGLTRVNSKFS